MSNINLEYIYIHTYLAGIGARSVKKLRDTLSLPVKARNDLYRILNKLVREQWEEKIPPV
jgi:hypothetical protein